MYFFYHWFINDLLFFFWAIGILSILNLAAFLFYKLCAKCHVLNIVVATMNGNVHCNVCGVKKPLRNLVSYELQLC